MIKTRIFDLKDTYLYLLVPVFLGCEVNQQDLVWKGEGGVTAVLVNIHLCIVYNSHHSLTQYI